MKTKITLLVVLIMLPVMSFMGNTAFAQTVSGTTGNTGCSNSGFITASSSGLGTAPEYQLLKAGIVIAPLPGDASRFATSSNGVFKFDGLENGNYTVKGRAGSGQTVFTSSSITVKDGYINMVVSAQAQTANCSGGTGVITVKLSGGKSPFTYKIALQSSQENYLQTSEQTTASTFAFNPLMAGLYTVSVTDACGQTVTGATSISNPTISLTDVKVGTYAYTTRDNLSCTEKIKLKVDGGFRYTATNTILSTADAALFTWKIKYKGQLYGKDTDGDGYADLNGAAFSLTTTEVVMPKIATRADIIADISNIKVTLTDLCGKFVDLSIIDYNKQVSYITLGNCGDKAIIKSLIGKGLDCLPVVITLTNRNNPLDIHDFTVTDNSQTFYSGDLTPGATYNVTYIDGEGYTRDLYKASSSSLFLNTVSNFAVSQYVTTTSAVSLNYLDYGDLTLKVDPIQPGDILTYTVKASNNPLVPVNYSYSASIDSFQNRGTGFPILPSPNPTDPSPYWPKGNYTLEVNAGCGLANVDVVVQGRTASLKEGTVTPICGGFNYVMNGTFDISNAYQAIVVSGPSSVGQTKDLANVTSSLPFTGLTYGTYVFGLRIKGGTRNVLTETVNYDPGIPVKIDRAKTGGYVCTKGSQDGTLTITATTNSPAPNNVLTYAISKDGGTTYLPSPYQNSNLFTGLSSGTYFFKVKDGCGNEITETAQIGVASAPIASADGLINPKLCKLSSGTVQLDVDIINGTYTWTGPGITPSNKNLKNPLINYSDLTIGANNYTCTIVLGAPCNTTNVANLTITADLPIVKITNPAAVCFPNTVDLTASAITAGSDTNLQFSYYSDNAGIIPLSNPNAVNTSGVYYIKAKNSTSCENIIPVNVVINALPVAEIKYNGTYCNRGTASVTLTGLNGGLFSGDSGLVINANSGEINLAASTLGIHNIIYTFSNGTCSDTSAAVITINETKLPEALDIIAGQCAVTIVPPSITDPCAGLITAETTTVFPITKSGETDVEWIFNYGNGYTKSLIQKVVISEIILDEIISASCAGNSSGYILTLSVNGEAPYTVTGTGAPGNWTGNTWTSDVIASGTDYAVNIQDKYKCNTLPVSGIAPVCCVFEVKSPTFPETVVSCYNELPTASSLTIAEFEALGNGDGIIGKNPCGVIEITASNSAEPACNGNIIRTYTITEYADKNNNKIHDIDENTILNVTTCTQTFTLKKADFTMPANGIVTVSCAAEVKAPSVPEVKDNCGNMLTASAPVISASPVYSGEVTYIYTFKDCSGNSHDWIYTYTIENTDFTMPANGSATVSCAAEVKAPAVPEVKDNCGNILTASAPVISSSPVCNGEVTYTYTFKDCSGNSHDWIYAYTIENTDFAMPANESATVSCIGEIKAPAVPEVTDNCGNILTASAPVISASPVCNGEVAYTYTFTDCSGNSHDWIYTYTIENTDFTMPANGSATVSCIGEVKAPAVPEVTDNCGNILTASAPVISASPVCNGGVTYTYTFTDCSGNSHDWVYTYTIENTVVPIGKAPLDLKLQCMSDIPASNVDEVTGIIANCNGQVTITVNDTNNGGKGCKGEPYVITRTYTLTDCSGLSNNLIQKITVEDTTAPVFVETLPKNSSINCADEIPTVAILKAIDNCSEAIVVFDEIKINGGCPGSYELHRTWTASDKCGNESIHKQIVKVSDTTAPFFVESLPDAEVFATCETIPSAATLTAADLCGSASVTYNETKVDGDCSSKYDLIRLWTAVDECGNKTDFTQTVHVSCLPEIYNAISPNGDGINDTFKIKGIDCYPNNHVTIYNRYGVLVYEMKGYDNVTNPFEGFSDGRATVKRGDKLPTGTYFYILEYDDNSNRTKKSGYLYINNQ